MSYVRWRAYIGPPFTRPSSSVHWDWSTLTIDAAYTPTSIATTSSGSTSAGAATVTVASTATFPSAGGFWIGSTRWSYVRYSGKTSTTFTGCTWTGDSEEQTTHVSGSTVRFWYPVTENNGTISQSWSMDENLVTMQWEASLGGGIKVPQSAIRNNHLILVQKATTPSGSFTNWLVGWLASPTIGEPSAYRRNWSAKIVSSPQKVAEIIADGVRVGDMNIARDGSASAISSLSVPYKERSSGDYTAAEPDLSPQSAIDGNDVTLWISEDVIGTPQTIAVSNDATTDGVLVISQVHIAPAVGEPDGYQWIELTKIGDGSISDLALWTDTSDLVNVGVGGAYTNGDKIIICADDVLFQQQNPRSSAALVYSIEDEGNSDFFATLDPAGGAIGVYYTSILGEGWLHDVIWGTGTVPDRGASNPTNRYGPAYTGGNVTAPDEGETMRYTFANSATPKNNWTTDNLDHAGYMYSTGDAYDEPWFLVELPSMGLQLAEDTSSSFTGTVTLKDDTGDTTGGLPSSGSLQIGGDIITYNSKTDTTINITGGASSAHVAGDPIYVYFSSVASDGVPINKINLNFENTAARFKNFKIYYSRLPNARTPGTSGYLDDYVLIANVTNNLADAYSLSFTTTRARKVLLLPTLLNTDPSRMRIREFEIMLDRTYYDTDLWLADGSPVVDLFDTLLQNAYMPAGAISTTDGGNHDMSDQNTERGNAWGVVADLADFAGYKIHVDRDSKFTITEDTFWTTGAGSHSASATWTRSTAAECSIVEDGAGVGTVSQVRLAWRSADGTSEGTSVYPASGLTDWRGDVLEVGPYIFANSTAADAAARKRYFTTKYPYTFFVRPVTPSANYDPGQIHRIQWAFDDSWGTVDRYVMVTRVTNEFTGMEWKQSFDAIQISREVPN